MSTACEKCGVKGNVNFEGETLFVTSAILHVRDKLNKCFPNVGRYPNRSRRQSFPHPY